MGKSNYGQFFFFLFGRSLGQRKGGAKAAERMVKKQKGVKRNTSLALGNVQEYLTVSPCAWPPQPEPDHKSNLAFPHESKLFLQLG